MAITVIVNKPGGEIEVLAVEPPAQIQAGPGFVFEFPDLDSSHVEYLVGGDDQDDLTIVLPDGGGEITLLGFQALLAGEEKATIRWGFGIEDGEQVAPDAGQDGGSGGPVSLIDAMIDFLTGLSLESLMNVRVGFRDPESEESEDFGFDIAFLEQTELLPDIPTPLSNDQGGPVPSGRIGGGLPLTSEFDDGFTEFGNAALSDDSQDQDSSPEDGSSGFTNEAADGNGGTATVTPTVTATVTAVNHAPSAAADGVTTNEDTAVTLSVLSNDIDIDGDSLWSEYKISWIR